MNSTEIKQLLELVKNNQMLIEEAIDKNGNLSFKDLRFTLIDNHQEIRVGYPEARNNQLGRFITIRKKQVFLI